MNADQMQAKESKLLHADLTKKIIGVYYDVYNEVGHGFLESVYHKCMEIALHEAGLAVELEASIPVWFRQRDVGQFRADLLVEKLILVELKAAQALDRSHEAQLMNYLRATQLEVGLLLNFGASQPQFKRIVLQNNNKNIRVDPK